MLKYLVIFLLFISCKSKVIYQYNYCDIMEVHLTIDSKKLEPRETKEAIVFNNLLRKDCE